MTYFTIEKVLGYLKDTELRYRRKPNTTNADNRAGVNRRTGEGFVLSPGVIYSLTARLHSSLRQEWISGWHCTHQSGSTESRSYINLTASSISLASSNI